MKYTAQEIADYLGGRIEGNGDVVLRDVGSISDGKKGELTFLTNPSYEDHLYTTKCSAVLVNEGFQPAHPVYTTLIYVEDAYVALAKLLTLREASDLPTSGISEWASVDPTAEIDPTAYVGPFAVIEHDAKIGANSYIMPQAFIGSNVKIGADCKVYSQAVVAARTVVGDRCVIHSGAVIGADGFGFAKTSEGYTKIPQTGNVVLEDDVEVGANTCIDRAVLDSTIIKRGVKLDDLVMIGHNAEIGSHSVLAGQSGVAGSAHIGAWNVLAGQVGISGHLKTAEGVTFAAQTGVISDVKEPNTVWFGSPAHPHSKAMRAAAKYVQLPDLDRTVYQLQKEVATLRAEVEQLRREKE